MWISNKRNNFGGSGRFRNIIDFVIMSSSGSANDFGDMRIAPLTNFALSNATRGITAGGLTAPTPSYTSNLLNLLQWHQQVIQVVLVI